MEGAPFCGASSLTELILDDCQFVFPGYEVPERFVQVASTLLSNDNDAVNGSYILSHCQHVERLSMKNATWSTSYRNQAETYPIPQEMLMKMVRRHAALRWLRSDLTEENLAILQQERPEITFVTE